MTKICLDAGHGGTDPGATNGANREADYALAITKKLGTFLKTAGIAVSYTRSGDTYVSLDSRSDYANQNQVDYFISIHLNSASSKQASGIETLIQGTGGQAERLAEAVQKELIASTNAQNRGVKVQNLSVTRKTNMPAILVETGFISNTAECALLASAAYQTTLAKAITKGVLKFLGVFSPETAPEEKENKAMYQSVNEVPEWGRATVQKLIDQGVLQGNEKGELELSYEMVRIFVVLERLNVIR